MRVGHRSDRTGAPLTLNFQQMPANTIPEGLDMTAVSRPNRPAKVVLTPNAKRGLTTAEMRDGGYWYLNATWCLMDSVTDAGTAELAALHLVDDMGPSNGAGFRFVLTENGLRMRTYLQHQVRLGKLAKQVRAEDIDGQDLADLAAGIDAGETTGTITGTTVDFQLAFALAASLSDQSAEDLRGDLERYMGW